MLEEIPKGNEKGGFGYKMMNFFEYLQKRLEKLENIIAKMFEEGICSERQWDRLVQLFLEIDKFLNYLKEGER